MIRTKSKVTGGVTDAEKQALAEHAQLWISRAMATGKGDRQAIYDNVVALYAAAKLPAPRVVVVPSPLVMAFAYGASAAIWYSRKTEVALVSPATFAEVRAATPGDRVFSGAVRAFSSAVRAATDTVTSEEVWRSARNPVDDTTGLVADAATVAATYAATDAATDAATRAATSAATDAAADAATDAATSVGTFGTLQSATYATNYAVAVAVSASTYAPTSEQQAAQACYSLAGPLGLACAKRWSSAYQGGNMWAGWLAYLTAFRDVLGLDIPEHQAFASYENLALHSGFRVLHEEFCIVSDFPEILLKDDQNRPHCETGPSHRWSDGYALYHWHGVAVPGEWIENKAGLTAKIALAEENVEKRRAACEIIGWAKVLKELNAKVIDKDPDPEIGTLLEVDLPDSGPERFIFVRCGTGREFALPVPRDCGDTALAANAWSYGLDKLQYRPEVRT